MGQKTIDKFITWIGHVEASAKEKIRPGYKVDLSEVSITEPFDEETKVSMLANLKEFLSKIEEKQTSIDLSLQQLNEQKELRL